ncbi:peroxiredoxin family protein [Dawidia soli]|uniref:Thioredoxin domain-containing protein n=1 Tax=Dawidia soli TaxID=2782352 RepID=A0AAP2GGL5_9BACT|nr:hypothetical protein [Dawidia soli]MBT1686256.1 hypothetical protein [Dawidia soli]
MSIPLSARAVAARGIAEINRARNAMVITEVKTGIPNMRNVFLEPWTVQELVSANRADTLYGASFQYAVLEDTFRVDMSYDGRHLVRVDEEQGNALQVVDAQLHPYEAGRVIGPLYMRIRTVMEQALKRNAILQTTEDDDSLRLEVVFPDLYLELNATGVMWEKDTVGFVSRYVVYLDKYTFLPIKLLRDMPHHTSQETVLYQRINFTDTLAIDALQTRTGGVASNLVLTDSLQKLNQQAGMNNLVGQSIYNWKLARVDGDTLSFTTLQGQKGVIVFNSVGWKPCTQVLPFLAQLSTTPTMAVVSIEPYVTNTDALKKHQETQAIDYPIVVADRTLKKTYPGMQVPTFLLTDTAGIVREVVVGYTGAATETHIQRALERLP